MVGLIRLIQMASVAGLVAALVVMVAQVVQLQAQAKLAVRAVIAHRELLAAVAAAWALLARLVKQQVTVMAALVSLAQRLHQIMVFREYLLAVVVVVFMLVAHQRLVVPVEVVQAI